MKIAITGASGTIGRRLLRLLEAHDTVVLGRKAAGLPSGVKFACWDAMAGLPPAESLAGVEAVIHLAGEPVAQRWSADAKRRIRDSRVDGTRRLVEAMGRMLHPPSVLVCASAVGYYGSRGDEILSEASAPGEGFLPEVCQAWEREAEAAGAMGVRVVRMRIGIVLAQDGGALKRMLPPFRAGVGGRIGSGRQWMSWVHVDDLAALIRFAIERAELQGAVNAVSPAPVTNAEFTRALASALRRPAFLPVPELALSVLFGEMAQMLTGSQRVVPFAADAGGFSFKYADVSAALRDAIR
jgi:uncharacterized protein (TIGR01777 family)